MINPVWLAYGQFVRTFVLPLLAYAKLGWPLQTALLRRDGYEPDELFASLPWHVLCRQPALSTVTLPRVLSRIGDGAASRITPSFARDPEISPEIILRNLDSLLRHARALTPKPAPSAWANYAHTANHHSLEDHAAKREFVAHALETTRPQRVLDVGCNRGVYSTIAADSGAAVVAIDTDLESVNRLSIDVQASGKNILPLCLDLARPTPAVGWENQESASFLGRCSGSFDMVMMLAVLHHLLVGSQIPLDRIAALCRRISTRSLIVEWVPVADPMFQQILRGRGSLYVDLAEAAFHSAFAEHFQLVRQVALANGRILCHFDKGSSAHLVKQGRVRCLRWGASSTPWPRLSDAGDRSLRDRTWTA